MDDAEFAAELKKLPCLSCGQVGVIEPHYMQVNAEFKGANVVAEGDATICTACGRKDMSDALTESLVNQISIIRGDINKHQKISLENGKFKTQYMN